MSRGLYLLGALAVGAVAVMTAQSSKPHRVVLEVTGEGAAQWESALNNVENLQKAFAPEPVEVEVVVHGKALPMLLRTNSAQEARMAKLAAAGARFVACENTMKRLKVDKGQLLPFITTVDSGVAEIVRKQEQGWAYLKGGA